ncbi:hypothetical protein [Labrys neptuniae]|uniref:Uncharacterized protein n=1 Tax=Labrys neptuniae TaxID=376174 RepID=A0ABV3PTU9_9HYPH
MTAFLRLRGSLSAGGAEFRPGQHPATALGTKVRIGRIVATAFAARHDALRNIR